MRINSRETLGIEVNNLCWRIWEGGVANAVSRCVAPEGASFTRRLRDYNVAALIGIQFRRSSKKSALERWCLNQLQQQGLNVFVLVFGKCEFG